ncbi:MAG: ABC transporter ATP-binding protein [Vicinamibacteraceae bacterium]|nr:ABC transporter ATP-binding protein [Vicinamibacteraceae bacterium]
MAVPTAIDAREVTKVYRRYSHRRQFATLKSALLSGTMIRDLRPDETFAALRNVSFQVPKGSTYGIIGRNGSGKSTALKLVAGISKPTSGTIDVQGRISALIELGAGFHPEISGRENVFINGIMLGLSKKEVQRRFSEIVEFAELEDFIDAPVKTYSSGMYMRLGFAVAIHVDPDVLLVDEVLAVGDEGFTHKCLDKFAEFRRRGKTILLVTHSLGLVERFCDEVLWLDAGEARAHGDPRRVVGAYITSVEKAEERQLAAADARVREAVLQAPPTAAPPDGAAASAPDEDVASDAPADMFQADPGRWGSREIEILGVDLIGEDDRPSQVFHTGERVTVKMQVRANRPATDFVFGFGLFNADGLCCYGTNTAIEELAGEHIEGDGEVTLHIDSLDLTEGTYKLDVAVHRLDGYPYDYHRLLYTFRVKSRVKDVGLYRPPHRWSFTPNIRLRTTAI